MKIVRVPSGNPRPQVGRPVRKIEQTGTPEPDQPDGATNRPAAWSTPATPKTGFAAARPARMAFERAIPKSPLNAPPPPRMPPPTEKSMTTGIAESPRFADAGQDAEGPADARRTAKNQSRLHAILLVVSVPVFLLAVSVPKIVAAQSWGSAWLTIAAMCVAVLAVQAVSLRRLQRLRTKALKAPILAREPVPLEFDGLSPEQGLI